MATNYPAQSDRPIIALTSPTDAAVLPSDGTVFGPPRRWLRLEGATLLVASIVAYSTTRQAWWLVPLTLLVPDLFAVGYLGGTRLGARLYNLAHSTVLPAALVGLGWCNHKPLAVALGLVWLAHIGVDRLLGFGLKYDDHAQHTHLGHGGRNARADHSVHPPSVGSAQLAPIDEPLRGTQKMTGSAPVLRVSAVGTGHVPIRPDHLRSTRRPTNRWLFAFRQ